MNPDLSSCSKQIDSVDSAYPNQSVLLAQAAAEGSASESVVPASVDSRTRTHNYGIGEGSRLRGIGDQSVSRDSDCHQPVAHPSSSRQHDLHESQSESRVQRTKKALNSLISTVSERILGTLRLDQEMEQLASEIESGTHLNDPQSREALHVVPSAPFAASTIGRAYESRLRTVPTNSPWEMVPSDTAHNHIQRGRPNRARNSAFCPCFVSPTISDDSESEDERTNSGQRRLSATAGWTVSGVARDLRMRLALLADATNQNQNHQLINQNIANRQSEPPIHRTVEYANYLIKDMTGVLAACYYWGEMDRFEAERLLEGKPEGTFLLRDSAQKAFLFSVSFQRYNRTLHARIEQANHRFGFDIHDASVFSSDTVTNLIENYKDPSKCLFFEPQLSQPLPRNFVFSLQELCRGVICSQTSYVKVGDLPVPQKLKQFVRGFHYEHPVRSTTHEQN